MPIYPSRDNRVLVLSSCTVSHKYRSSNHKQGFPKITAQDDVCTYFRPDALASPTGIPNLFIFSILPRRCLAYPSPNALELGQKT